MTDIKIEYLQVTEQTEAIERQKLNIISVMRKQMAPCIFDCEIKFLKIVSYESPHRCTYLKIFEYWFCVMKLCNFLKTI